VSAVSEPQQQRWKRAAVAPAASSTTTGKKFKYGPSLKAPPPLPYEMSEEDNKKIMDSHEKAHFAPKRPPQKEKIDPVKDKRTLDNLRRPPPPPPLSNYDRTIQKTYAAAVRSGSTNSETMNWENNSPARRTGKAIVPPAPVV
jgi:hypothetical protein